MAKIVFTNGCFDLFHVGHLETLKSARVLAGLAGTVVVGLNSDESIKKLKGDTRPIIPQDQRKSVLEACRYVDYVVIFDEETPDRLIQEISPDVILKGGDYANKEIVGGDKFTTVTAKYVEKVSTSQIILDILLRLKR